DVIAINLHVASYLKIVNSGIQIVNCFLREKPSQAGKSALKEHKFFIYSVHIPLIRGESGHRHHHGLNEYWSANSGLSESAWPVPVIQRRQNCLVRRSTQLSEMLEPSRRGIGS